MSVCITYCTLTIQFICFTPLAFSKKLPMLKMSGNIALSATFALPHGAYLLSSRVPGSGAEYKNDDFY